jgi:aspartate/methionine/tyrosine aminotransferase
MFFAILALVEEGDEVLLPNPAFPIYESMVNFVGGEPVFVPLRQENGFRFDLDEFRAGLSEKTKLVILNSPANPTGGVLTREDMVGLAEILRERPDLFVLTDEIYSRLIYSGEFASLASEEGMAPGDGRTIILDGFSKTYAMTGWRLGYGVMPEPLAAEIAKLQVNSNSCVSAATQYAGLEALTGPQDHVDVMLSEFRARRDLIVSGLNALPGVECATPEGAFYAFPRISGTGHDAGALADLLLEEAGVACLSGAGFGRHGEGHLRFSYANSQENISRAIDRMGGLLRKNPARTSPTHESTPAMGLADGDTGL